MWLKFKVIPVLLILALVFGITACSDPGKSSSGGGESKSTKTAEGKATDFPKKNIHFIIPVSPGGGFDTLVRMFAPYWEKQLPNNVKIVIENKPGGEWRVGLSEINKAAGDGYTVGILNIPGNLTDAILGKKDALDLTKFVQIGRITDVVYVLAASKQSGLKNWDDFKNSKKELKTGTVGLNSTGGIGSVIIHEEAGVKVKVIPHDGSNESVLSAIRGTVDDVLYPFATLKKSLLDSKDLVPLVVVADERHPSLPDVPTVKEVGLPQLLATVQLHRLVAASPGTPDDVAKILRDSFMKATEDPEFKQKMVKEDGVYHPADYKVAQNIMSDSLKSFAKYKDLMLEYSK